LGRGSGAAKSRAGYAHLFLRSHPVPSTCMGNAFVAEAERLKSAAGRALRDSATDALPPTVYHYTSVDTAVKILNSFEMWCTNVSLSNDPSEGVHGQAVIDDACVRDRDLLLQGARKLISEDIEGYATSFSTAADELTQWRSYCGNGRGVSLGVDTKVLGARSSVVFSHVLYDRGRQEDLVRTLLNLFRGRMLSAKSRPSRIRHLAYVLTVSFVIARAMMKDPAYHSEREYRLLDALPKDSTRHNTKLESFRRGENEVPFFRVDLRNSSAPRANQPFREVYVGPCLDFADAKKQLIETAAYRAEPFRIEQSRVPMRGD
jgi:hypothetical protein